MYDIYMKNYVDTNGVYQTSHEFLVYSVPIVTNKERAFIDPTVSVEMGKAGSFEFSISPKNPYYNSWKQMKTILRVAYDGSTIFRGRVLTISKNDITGVKKIHCEGDLAYLLDSQHAPVKQEKRPVISIFNYLEQLIAGHNDQMLINGEQDKTYALGEVPGNYTNATPENQRVHTDATLNFGSDSWENTMTALDNLVKQYGGYLRTRYVSEVQIRIDWLDNWFDANPNGTKQTIRVRENLINQDSSSEVNNIFTALIPLGSSQSEEVNIRGYRTDVHGNNNYILVPQIVGLYTDAQLNTGYHSKSDYQNAINNYGVIFKTQKFDNADTQEKLFNYATDFIKENYVGGLTGFTIGAVDMHHVDGTVVKYLVGDRIPIQYPDHDNRTGETPPLITRTVTAIAIKYVLHNPEKNEYSLGIPNNLIQRKYGTNKSKKSSSGGGSKKQQDDEDIRKAMDNDRSEVGVLAWNYVINEKYNNAEYQALLAEDPNLQYAPTVLKSTKTVIKGVLQNDPRQKQTFQTIILDGNTGEVGFMQNPALGEMARATKSLLINGFSAKLTAKELIEAGQTNQPKTLMEMYSDPDKFFKFQAWKKGKAKEDPQATLAAMISGEDGTIASIINKLGLDGSGLKSTIIQDGLTSMLKFFNPSTASSQTPEQTAEIDGGAGTGKIGKTVNNEWQVKLNDTVTYVDQDGNTQTLSGFVSAKDFNIPEIASFKTKLIVVDNLIANRATIGQLEAQKARIDTLFTNKLNTNDLYASIAALESVSVKSLTSNRGGISVYSVGTTSFTQGGVECYVPNAIKDVQVVAVAGTDEFKLQYKSFGNDSWQDAGTFSRAAGVSSVVWGWSGGKARATIYFTDGTSQVEESPALDYYDQYGNPTWASNKKSFTQQIKVYDDSDPATEIATLSGAHSFSTVESFNAGWMKAILDCEFPSTGNNNPITVTMPNNETVEGTARTRSYTLSADNNYVYLKRTDSGMSATVGRASNPAFANGEAAMGVIADTTNHKIKSGETATKEIAITAGAGQPTWNSTTKKFEATGYAYAAGTQIAESSTKGQTNEIKLTFGSFTGSGASKKRTVKVQNGSADLAGLSANISDYGDGYSEGNTNGYTSGYSAGDTAGRAAMGVTADTTNHKIKAAASATKEIAITAGAGQPTWNSTTKKFEVTGYAYAAGTQIAESSTKGQTNEIKLTFTSFTGSGASKKRTVKVQNGSSDLAGLSANISDYGDGYSEGNTNGYTSGYSAGFDADHNPRITYGSTGSCNGDFEMGKGVKAHSSKTDGSTQESAGYWYVPGCHLVVLSSTPSSYISNLGFGSYIEVIGVNHDGSQQHFGKIWRIPPASEAYPNTIALKQQAGYAGASKMVMYYKDNQGNYHAAGGGASLAWYMSATSLGNTGSYKTLRYE